MKTLKTILFFLSMISSLTARAQLSHEEFLRLNSTDQVEYVDHLKMIITNLTESSRYFAGLSQEASSEPRNVASQSYTPDGDPKSIEFALSSGQNEYEKFTRLLNEKKQTGKAFKQEAELEKSTRLVRLHLVSAAHQAQPLSGAERSQTLKRIGSVSSSFERSLVNDSKLIDPDAFYTADSNLITLKKLNVSTANYGDPNQIPSVVKKSPASKKYVPPVAKEAPTPATASVAKQAAKLSTGAASNSEAVCIYAGFVIEKDRCMPETKLPFELTELNSEIFVCDAPGILCNPLLFGYDINCDPEKHRECLTSARPLCTVRKKDATQICRNQSKDEKYTKRAVSLIKNNKAAYEKFIKNFEQLCDGKTIQDNPKLKFTADQKPRKNYKDLLADVIQTCEVTKAQLETVTAIYQSSLAHNSRSAESPGTTR